MKIVLAPTLSRVTILCFGLLISLTTLAQSDECASAIALPSYAGTACGGATAGSSAFATQSMVGCTGDADDDVWFSFVAHTGGGQTTITITGGGGGGMLNPAFEVFSGTCGSLTSIFCDNSASNNTEAGTPQNLVNGQTYYVRVYSAALGSGQGSFTICVTRVGTTANDNCSAATLLTPASTCVGGAGGSQAGGNLANATNSGIAAGPCGGNPDDDVWYRFVAGNASQLINVTGIGSAIAVNGSGSGGSLLMEVFSSSDNTCTGTLTNIVCGTPVGTSLAAQSNSFIPGNTYFVRLYSTNSVSHSNNAGFTICVTNPPVNDNCAGAVSVIPAATCVSGAGGSQVSGTLANATNSGIAASCVGNPDDDVWYSFVAQNLSQTITLSNLGANIVSSGAGIGGSAMMEVFSSSTNDCMGTLTSIACGYASGANIVAYANSLTIGNTYFVRVYSANSVTLNGNAGFNFCVTNPYTGAPNLHFGKSFINITKGLNGGTVETGDVIEIRAAVVLRPTSILDSCAFYDNVPAGTAFVPGSLAILTNEGKVYKSFTDVAGDDAGTMQGGAITINMGFNANDNAATAFRRGRLRNTHIPTVGGPACVMLASYRVTVTAALNSVISIGGGTFTYSSITDPTNVTVRPYNTNNVRVYTNTGLCSNASGVNVLDLGLAGDFNGTFGSGNEINRAASPNMPPGYTYTTLTGGRPGDFHYAIPNNTSNNPAGFATNDNWAKPESPILHRIYGVWDVIGDHTGAADQLAGNPAADTTNGQTGGYMLLVNAAYNLDTVFKYPISGLCPNTYYELSFWVRNVCSRCGVDSLGRGASGVSVPAGYIPTDVGDSAGVYPNLSFSIDDINHYTTGNIRYTGQWVKKGFVFRTGPAQTSIEFAIVNNAPGGGGNDWALDDISVSTCTPNLNLVPSGNSQVCYNNQVDLSCDVISYFNNYVYYQWQVSHDNGVTWTDTLAMQTGTPVYTNGNYVYNAHFPSFLADSSQHMKQYRIRVATNPANLYGGCSFYNSTNIIVMVNNCEWVLKTDLLSFDAVLKNKHGVLTWKAANETAQTTYEVQRSSDGSNFHTIATVKAQNLASAAYTFNDPEEIRSFAYYRVVVKEPGGSKNSRIRLLNVTDVPYELISVVNPFNNKLSFVFSSPRNGDVTIMLNDQQGRSVKTMRQRIVKGVNYMDLDDLGSLSAGTYILQVITDSGAVSKRVVKVNN